MGYWNSYELKQDFDNGLGIISGYASCFNVVDQGSDLILPGSYTQTIADTKALVASGKQKYLLPFLWQHDPEKPIGGVTDLIQDNYGLKFTAQLLLSIGKAVEVWCLLKDKVISGISIGYDVMDGGAMYLQGVRNISKIKLWELSVVTFPMCTQATVTSVKSKREAYA